METPEIRTNADEVRNVLDAVYCRFPGQCRPQPAYIELDPEDCSLWASYNPVIGNAVPARVWHSRAYRISISPYLTGQQVADLLEDREFLGLAAQVVDGYETTWDGNNLVGVLTPEAHEALEKMRAIAKKIDGLLQVYEVGDYLQYATVPPEATDEDLRQMAADIIDGLEPNTIIDGDIDDIIDYLRFLRDKDR